MVRSVLETAFNRVTVILVVILLELYKTVYGMLNPSLVHGSAAAGALAFVFIVICLLAYLSYRGNRPGIWAFAFYIGSTGLGCFVVATFAVSSQSFYGLFTYLLGLYLIGASLSLIIPRKTRHCTDGGA